MSKLFNLGRVVGYSAYEIFAKNFLTNHPDEVLPSEREWLASMLGSGSSLLLRVNYPCVKDDGSNETVEGLPCKVEGNYITVEYEMPYVELGERDESGTLIEGTGYKYYPIHAASTVIAHPFFGDAKFDNSLPCPWFAIGVDDYNDEPDLSQHRMSHQNWAHLQAYAHIVDGTVVSTVEEDGEVSPLKQQTLHIRFRKLPENAMTSIAYAAGQVKCLVLLTGFTLSAVLEGTSNAYGKDETSESVRGEFLGPNVLPEVSKIVFTVPTACLTQFEAHRLDVIDSTNTLGGAVNPGALVFYDLPESVPDDSSSAKELPISAANSISGVVNAMVIKSPVDGAAPALYATAIPATASSEHASVKIYPVRIAYPGTLMVCDNQDEAKNQVKNYPGTYGIYRDGNGWYLQKSENDSDHIVKIESGTSTEAAEDRSHRLLKICVGDQEFYALSAPERICPKPNTDPDAVRYVTHGELRWDMLLDMLHENYRIDFLRGLVDLRDTWPNIDTTGYIKAAKSITAEKEISGDVLQSTKNYILIGGTRLYVSEKAPKPEDDEDERIPVGSLGIGWL